MLNKFAASLLVLDGQAEARDVHDIQQKSVFMGVKSRELDFPVCAGKV
jgi:hypothetical protein